MTRRLAVEHKHVAAEPERRLHICRIADVRGDQLGGVNRAMTASSELLTARGHLVDLWFSEDMSTPGPRRCRRILVPLIIPLRVISMKARGNAPDLIEVHEPLGAPYALLRKLTPGDWLPPMVTLSHGLEELGWRAQKARWRSQGQRGPMKSRILVPVTLIAQAKIAVRLADAVIVLSSQDREHLLTKRAMRGVPIHQVHNGVEQDLLNLDRTSRGHDESLRLLFVGAWTDRKGTPELAGAFARLRRDHPNARLAVAGAGVRPSQVLSSFPTDVHAHVEVHRAVTRAELRDHLLRADLYVLPSWFEGMPLSLLEAAAAGLPIVASDTCGIRDVLRPADPAADGGRLVPPQDCAALHRELDRLARDSQLRAELGARARIRAGAFTWAQTADALEQVYLASTRPGDSVGRRVRPLPRSAISLASLARMSRQHVDHRPNLRWRRRHIFGAFRLRPAVAEHSRAEGELLQQHAAGARTVVELGVAEGGSALELRQVMAADGRLVLVDPYVPGRLGVSFSRLVARRTVSRSSRGKVTWVRSASAAAAREWQGDVDFLFIDADHSLAAVTEDWELWTPHVRVGGHVALHDARAEPDGWTGDRRWITPTAGPVVLTDAVRRDDAWALAGETETTVVFRRVR